MEIAGHFVEHYRSFLNSLKVLIAVVFTINLIFILEYYYSDSMLAYILLNLLLILTLLVFVIVRIVFYFKDRKR